MISLRAAATGLTAAALTLAAAPLASAADGSGLSVTAIGDALGRGSGVEITAGASLSRFADSHGDITLTSDAFGDFINLKPGDSTTAVIRCDIKPGSYDVRVVSQKAKKPAHTKIKVDSSRDGSCTTTRSGGPDTVVGVTSHGSDPDDPSSIHPGSKVDLSTGVEGFAVHSDDSPLIVDSNAFTKPVTLKEGKAGFAGTGTLRCDIKPGTYAVELTGPDVTAHDLDDGGRTTVKVYPGHETACAHPKHKHQAQAADTSRSRDEDGPSAAVLAASAAGTAVLAAAAGYTAGRRRNR
ncbi:hypothetical protein AB0D04_30455 [Streptomyces sp. NPDC048483]|uniref:hypothetical protein n=1 Tax=Streptomyces sp. NPDC048483 TaxID=3154927 RepID=UPI00343D6546